MILAEVRYPKIIFDAVDNDQVKLFEVATHFEPVGLWMKPWVVRRPPTTEVQCKVAIPRWVAWQKGVGLSDHDLFKFVEVAVRVKARFSRPFPYVDKHVENVTRAILRG